MRSLEREISKICRKVVKGIQLKKYDGKVVVTEDNLNDFLGVRKYDYGRAEKKNQVGQVVGLAWTEVGGDLLTIEAAVMPGKGNIIRTGSLGDVMKESVEAARSVVRSRARRPGHQGRDVREARHPHPRARRRDAEGRPERGRGDDHGLRLGADRHPGAADVAMTGEITLRGEVTAHRRPEGEAARGAPRRHQDGADPRRERQGPAGDSGEREEPPRDRAGEVDRPGAGSRARDDAASRCRTTKRRRSNAKAEARGAAVAAAELLTH